MTLIIEASYKGFASIVASLVKHGVAKGVLNRAWIRELIREPDRIRTMRSSTKVMPVASAITALSTFACCLPISLSAAVGIATLGVVFERYRSGLIAISILFLAIGVFQLYRFKRTCRKSSVSDIVIVVLAGIIVVGVSLFPQAIAVLLADLFP